MSEPSTTARLRLTVRRLASGLLLRARHMVRELVFAAAAITVVLFAAAVAVDLERTALIHAATTSAVLVIALRAFHRIVTVRPAPGAAPAPMGTASFGGALRESPAMTGVLNPGEKASPEYLRVVALHEAAHAVAGHVLGATVLTMTMTKLGAGHTNCGYQMDNTDVAEVSATYRTLALVALAGWVQDAAHPNAGAGADWRAFTDYAYRCVSMGQAGSFDEFFTDALTEVRTILAEHRTAMEALADALEQKKSLGQAEIARLLSP